MKLHIQRMSEDIVNSSLKKSLLLFFLVFFSLTLLSQTHCQKLPSIRKEIKTAGAFQHIEVKGDIAVVEGYELVEGADLKEE